MYKRITGKNIDILNYSGEHPLPFKLTGGAIDQLQL